jgi:hypothetical protein
VAGVFPPFPARTGFGASTACGGAGATAVARGNASAVAVSGAGGAGGVGGFTAFVAAVSVGRGEAGTGTAVTASVRSVEGVATVSLIIPRSKVNTARTATTAASTNIVRSRRRRGGRIRGGTVSRRRSSSASSTGSAAGIPGAVRSDDAACPKGAPRRDVGTATGVVTADAGTFVAPSTLTGDSPSTVRLAEGSARGGAYSTLLSGSRGSVG